MRGRRAAFIYPARSLREPHSLPSRSIFSPRSSPPFPLSFPSSSSRLSFCHSRDILRERPSLSDTTSLSFFLTLSAFLSSLLGVLSLFLSHLSNRKLLQSISPPLFQRDDSKYTLTPLSFLVLSFIIIDARGHLSPFRLSRAWFPPLSTLFSCSLVFSLFLARFRYVSLVPPRRPPRQR